MKKQNFLSLTTISWVIMVVCLMFLFLQRRSLQGTIFEITTMCNHEKQHLEAKNVVLQSNLILAKRSTGKVINGEILLTNVRNEKHTTNKIFARETPFLVFRYSETGGCSPCVNATFEHLRRLRNSVCSNKLQIIVIPHNMTLRQMMVESSLSVNSQFAFYLADEIGLGLPVDNEFVSYLTIVDRHKTSNVFVVDRMFMPLLEGYINILIENYN